MEAERMRVTAQAPAKINLVLSVGPVRPDGYHDLATIFHAISLYDQVEVRLDDDISVTIEGRQASKVPTGAENLAVRAAASLAEYAGVRSGVALHIRKMVPVAGGLAGGSADAAATLVACDALWETGLGRAELRTLAARLGSDVPFALEGMTALGTGLGEQLTPVLVDGRFHWVIAVATRGLSTPVVYAELDRLRHGRRVPRPDAGNDVVAALRGGDAKELATTLRNDLLSELLGLPKPHLVVDGYNVTKSVWSQLPLEAQRARLVRGLGALAARTGAEVTCVFDGADVNLPPPVTPVGGVRVRFSPEGQIADELIRRLVWAEPPGRNVIVVSSDREVAASARRPGGYAVASAALAGLLDS